MRGELGQSAQSLERIRCGGGLVALVAKHGCERCALAALLSDDEDATLAATLAYFRVCRAHSFLPAQHSDSPGEAPRASSVHEGVCRDPFECKSCVARAVPRACDSQPCSGSADSRAQVPVFCSCAHASREPAEGRKDVARYRTPAANRVAHRGPRSSLSRATRARELLPPAGSRLLRESESVVFPLRSEADRLFLHAGFRFHARSCWSVTVSVPVVFV